MATGSMPRFTIAPPDTAERRDERAAVGLPWRLLRAAGSLKVTVVMFLAATFLLFVGTLAQDEKNMPEVKAEYFNSWVAWVPWSDFFPVTVFGPSSLRWGFPFPGGATIGLVLLVNLIAAKATRFHVAKASPARLAWGTGVTLLGAVIVGLVLLSGHRGEGLQGRPPIGYDAIWRCVQAGAVLSCCGLAAAAWCTRRGPLVRAALAAAAAGLAILAALAVGGGDAWRMGEPGLRIMWQLIQSSLAAVVLLVGLVMVFGQRGGNVLIHLAVGLLMVGQFAFGDRQLEQRISLLEGRSTNMVFRSDETELAVHEPRGSEDRVTAIAARLLQARAGGAPIDVDGLPFRITVLRWLGNSTLVPAGTAGENPATAGLGTRWLALPRPPEGGSSSRSNIASAYVRLEERDSGRDLGTYLVTQYVNDQAQIFMGGEGDECDEVEAGGSRWLLQLRFRRDYKPYTVRLDDVRRVNYSASETPRDYSSHVTFTDRASGAEQKARIWMNNPVRYRGETFYQSQYLPADAAAGRPVEMTGLQVVENAGWLIPYVACVLAFWGMLVHFGITFVRFADRRARDVDAGPGAGRATSGPRRLLVDALMVVLPVAVCALPAALPRRVGPNAADWPGVGTLAVMHEGRLKPLDTVARNLLQLLGSRSVVRMPADASGLPANSPRGRVPAARWLLGVMAGADWTEHAPVFRIDAPEVVDLFDLARRPGHRYCAAELEAGRPALRRQIEALRDVPAEQRSFAQKKMLEINQKLQAYDLVRLAYETPALAKPEGDGEEARLAFAAQVRRVLEAARMVDEGHPPALVPPARAGVEPDDADRWQALYPALVAAIRAKAAAGDGPFRINPAIIPLSELLAAVDAPAADFNRALDRYRSAVDRLPEVRAGAGRVAYEAWFNAFNPTDLAKWLYVVAVVLCFTSFLVWHGPLNRFVSCMLLGVLVLHTFALASRVWLTGRPPVVNLYSSAVFIGWACVLAGLVLEWMHRMGVGNLVAALAGALTLMVAYGLDSGDTMHVLQAVLDTQFWLSTHVITVTLGYGATFLAGLLGTCAIVHRAWTWRASTAGAEAVQERLYRMTYGVVCFALFFSFIGTVLGGLWADDSWGRFWGWDPKENGALMIVLWNAAVLHARWDRWIGPRGFALFAVGGNIVTAWSWFGTNQLGIGLHSYGFTSGVLMLLGGYVLSQLVLIVVGLLLPAPRRAVTA